jgi:hypothetical protein
MFKNRALRVQVVKTNSSKNATDSSDACSHLDFDKINKIAKEQVKYVGIAVIGVYAAVTALNTASEIAINAAPKR